jgi:hypothetical protein
MVSYETHGPMLSLIICVVALIFNHFRPTGTALISLTRPDYLKENLKMLDSASIASTSLKAEPRLLDDVDAALPRTRGEKGREEASARGAVKGNGPHAGIPSGEKTVTIWGLPGKTEVPAVETILRNFNLSRTRNGKGGVYKIVVYVLCMPNVAVAILTSLN